MLTFFFFFLVCNRNSLFHFLIVNGQLHSFLQTRKIKNHFIILGRFKLSHLQSILQILNLLRNTAAADEVFFLCCSSVILSINLLFNSCNWFLSSFMEPIIPFGFPLKPPVLTETRIHCLFPLYLLRVGSSLLSWAFREVASSGGTFSFACFFWSSCSLVTYS